MRGVQKIKRFPYWINDMGCTVAVNKIYSKQVSSQKVVDPLYYRYMNWIKSFFFHLYI